MNCELFGQTAAGLYDPGFFVALDHIPLTSNGKIAREKLPRPDMGNSAGPEVVQPETEHEIKVAQAFPKFWNVLGLAAATISSTGRRFAECSPAGCALGRAGDLC